MQMILFYMIYCKNNFFIKIVNNYMKYNILLIKIIFFNKKFKIKLLYIIYIDKNN